MHNFHHNLTKKEYAMIAIAVIFIVVLITVFTLIFSEDGNFSGSGESISTLKTSESSQTNTVTGKEILKEYVCWDNTRVADPSICPKRMCDVSEEYTETEDYSEYEETNTTVCFDTLEIEEICIMEQVRYFQMMTNCNLVEGSVSCVVANLGSDAAAFSVNIGFGEGLLKEGTTKTESIANGQTKLFSYLVGHEVDSRCYCEVSAPKIEVCTEKTVPKEVCEEITKYNPVTKQRKITKYRIVKKPCK